MIKMELIDEKPITLEVINDEKPIILEVINDELICFEFVGTDFDSEIRVGVLVDSEGDNIVDSSGDNIVTVER